MSAQSHANGKHAKEGSNGDNEENPSCFYFLSPSAARELPLFQYKGEDLSLLYYYVLSPLASFCVNRLTPRTVAPNTITLSGLLFMVAAYSVMWFYVPTLVPPEEEPPRWIYLLNCIAMLIYQTMDNMDGKQARRTGSSSPLGLLFDHGCDAVNSIFGSANWIISMALHPSKDAWLCWILLFGPYGLFFIGTFEEYYTGALILPIVNGPSEGLLGGALMSLASWYYGPQIWQQTNTWNDLILPMLVTVVPSTILPHGSVRNADLLAFLSTIGFVQEIVIKSTSVAQRFGVKALLNLVPFATLVVCSLGVGLTDANIWLETPRTCLHLCAALFVEMTVDLMVRHITKENYQPLRWTLLPLVLFTFAVVAGFVEAGRQAEDFLLIYASAVTTYVVLRYTILVDEICHVLNIWCFDIVTPRAQSKLDKPPLKAENGHAKGD